MTTGALPIACSAPGSATKKILYFSHHLPPCGMRWTFLLPLILLGCVTIKQGTVGYIVPGGEIKGTVSEVRTCGSIGAWTFLLDDAMVDRLQNQSPPAKDAPAPANVEFIVRLDVSSCYILRKYAEVAQ